MANSVLEYEAVNRDELVSEGLATLEIARSFEITTQSTYELAADEVRDIKFRIRTLDEKRKSITSKFDEAKKAVMELFKPGIEKLEAAKTYYESGMVRWAREQERIKAEAQARAEAAARAERERLEAEARKIEEKAAKTKNEEIAARLREEAAAAQAAAEVVTPVVVAAAPVTAGTSIRKTWKGRCTDKMKLLEFIIKNPAFIDLVDVNQSALNKIASAQQKNMDIGGCESYQDSSVVSRK